MTIRYLSATELLYLNAYLSQREKMPFGIKSLSALEEAIARPQLKLEGDYEPFPDVWQKPLHWWTLALNRNPLSK